MTATRIPIPALKADVWVTGTDPALDTADATEVLSLAEGLDVELRKGLVNAVMVVFGSEVGETQYDNVNVVEMLIEEAEDELELPESLSSRMAFTFPSVADRLLHSFSPLQALKDSSSCKIGSPR